jgi:HlyD family secretion protein
MVGLLYDGLVDRTLEDNRCCIMERANVPPQTESPEPGTFRQAALDRVNSPAQLDRLLTVTTARSWIALTGVAALIATALSWSVIGRISSYVEGQGVFIREGGSIASAAASGSGTLARVSVGKGDQVKAGQVVAHIVAPDVEQQIAGSHALVAERETELQRQQNAAAAEIKANRAALSQREAGLVQILADSKRYADALKGRLADQRELFVAGIVTRSAVLDVQAQVDQALKDVDSTGDQIIQLNIQLRDLTFQAEQRVKNAEFSLADARRQLSDRVEAYRVGSEVRAPAAGTVNEIQLRAGSLVGQGQSVLTIATLGHGLGFVLFTSLREGEKIQRGQSVRISPNWTLREEEGTMIGSVTELSKLPITPEGLRSLLHSEDLVRHFSREGPVFIVRVQLEPDPATKSGYAWTSSKGAEVPVESESFGDGEVLVKSQRPITLAIPALRRWTGIGTIGMVTGMEHHRAAR